MPFLHYIVIQARTGTLTSERSPAAFPWKEHRCGIATDARQARGIMPLRLSRAGGPGGTLRAYCRSRIEGLKPARPHAQSGCPRLEKE